MEKTKAMLDVNFWLDFCRTRVLAKKAIEIKTGYGYSFTFFGGGVEWAGMQIKNARIRQDLKQGFLEYADNNFAAFKKKRLQELKNNPKL
jgi:hypothetical protein